jgi:hypothetical protein
MSATNAPFGLRPAFHPSGLDRAQALANGITSGYASNILKGQAVQYGTTATASLSVLSALPQLLALLLVRLLVFSGQILQAAPVYRTTGLQIPRTKQVLA